MKRSEMLDRMKSKAKSFEGERITEDFYDRYLEAILQEIEDSGMSPPEMTRTLSDKEVSEINLLNKTRVFGYDAVISGNIWEPED